jgi:hypothetical protein
MGELGRGLFFPPGCLGGVLALSSAESLVVSDSERQTHRETNVPMMFMRSRTGRLRYWPVSAVIYREFDRSL